MLDFAKSFKEEVEKLFANFDVLSVFISLY
jgi:hypothetical protein